MAVNVALSTLCALLPILYLSVVQSADVVDVSKRFRYSLHKNYDQAFTHPTIEALLGVPNTVKFKAVSSEQTVHGVVRRRFRQTFNDREVLGMSVEANVDADGNYDLGPVTGKIVLSLNDDIPAECTLTEQDAFEIVIQGESIPVDAMKLDQFIEIDVEVVGSTAHLVYVVDMLYLMPNGSEIRPYYIIDCTDGYVIDSLNLIQTMSTSFPFFTGPTEAWSSPTPQTPAPPTGTPAPTTTPPPTPAPTPPPQTGQCSTQTGAIKGGNPKLGDINYGTPPFCLELTVDGANCKLENQYVKVIDADGKEETSKTDPIQFVCSQGMSPPVVNGGNNPAADAIFYGTSTYKMFRDWYNTTPLNSKPNIYVNYGDKYENAFWDGQNMAFGNGDTTFYPLVSLNVVAHEIAHGYTEQKSDLTYSGQSGGMNEAFSDMAGEAVEQYTRNSFDWKVGFNIFKDQNGAMRYFDDPKKDGDSIDHVSKFTSGMDVHYSSGVYNKVFHEVVQTGKIPMRYAFESFVKANSLYWVKDSTFASGSCGAIRGALDAGLDIDKFIDAFKVVGITKDCKLNTFLEQLTQNKDRTGVKVSAIRQPIFGVKTGASTSKFTVTATSASGANVKLVVMTTLSRSTSKLPESTNSLQLTPATANTLYYVRLYTDSNTEISDVTVKLQLE